MSQNAINWIHNIFFSHRSVTLQKLQWDLNNIKGQF